MVEDICSTLADKPAETLLIKIIPIGSINLRLLLVKETWMKMLQHLEFSDQLTLERARDIRNTVTLAHQRRDYRDSRYICQQPAHRLCNDRFHHDGVLVPFGHSREQFLFPNPSVNVQGRFHIALTSQQHDLSKNRDLANARFG